MSLMPLAFYLNLFFIKYKCKEERVMKVFDTSLLVFKKDLKSHVVYGLTILFSIVVCFTFINFIDNPILIASDRTRGIDHPDGMGIPLSKGLPFIIILFSWFSILYATHYYLNQKNKEFSIMMISGMNLFANMKYTLIQIGFILIVIIPLSFIFGTISLFIINKIIYDYLHIQHSIFDIPISTFITTLYAIMMLVFVIIVVLMGTIHRNSILSLSQKSNKNYRIIKLKKKSLVFIFIYFVGLYDLITTKPDWISYTLFCIVGMLGGIGALKKCIPQMLLHSKKNLKGKDSYICLSHLGFTLKSTSTLVGLVTILTTIIIPILAIQTPYTNEYIVGIISYIFIIILIFISIIYKLNIELKDRVYEYSVLEKIGFTKNN